tara:strand:- start:203 stop:343 length:141 start_codon:yes stop_codon:yes gene_type:complete
LHSRLDGIHGKHDRVLHGPGERTGTQVGVKVPFLLLLLLLVVVVVV